MGVSPAAPEQWHRRGGCRCRRWEPLNVEVAVAPSTSVAVMAPALTEGGPQKPKDLISPLPAGGFLSPEKAAQVCKNREVLAKFVVSANVQPSKIDEQCLRGISKDLIRDVINSKYENGLDCLTKHCVLADDSDDLISSDIDILRGEEENNYINKEQKKQQQQLNVVKHPAAIAKPDSKLSEGSRDDAIMSEPSATDQNDEMGFIKTNDIVPMVSVLLSGNANLSTAIDTLANDDDDHAGNGQLDDDDDDGGGGVGGKDDDEDDEDRDNDDDDDDDDGGNDNDKDLDGIMGLNTGLPSNVVGDLVPQNVDDILQVIQSMEGDEQIMTGETSDTGVNAPEIFNMSEGFTSFERDLLNEVDVDVINLVNENMSINMNLNIGGEANERQKEDNNLRMKQESIEQRSFQQDKRTAFLMRRLRKLQTRALGRHIAEETTGIIEQAHHSVKKYFLQDIQNIPSTSSKGSANSRILPQIPDNLNSFVNHIGKSCATQSNAVTAHCNRQRNYFRYFGAGSRDIAIAGTSNSALNSRNSSHIHLDAEQLESVAGPLNTHLHTLESNFDSDCTASSSGGESCDEMINYNNPHQQQLSISKRAAWRYAQDRAGVAARWTWLQAQISDLDYKIRQHHDLQRQLRSTKGLPYLENAETVNGYSGVLPGSTSRHNLSENDANVNTSSCRTRPFVWESYRKRKLLRLEGLHEYSKRAARSSTIRCQCNGELAGCVICTGRRDPMYPQETFEMLSSQERISLVDPSYHPILSFREDVTHSTHFDAIMKTVDWQQKILRGHVKMTKIKDKDITERRNKGKLSEHRTKYTTTTTTANAATAAATTGTTATAAATTTTTATAMPTASATIATTRMKKTCSSNALTARIRRKMLKGKRGGESTGHGRSLTGISRKKQTKLSHAEDDDDISAQSSSSKHSSPVPSPLQHHVTSTATASTEKVSIKERNLNSHTRIRQNSYDIDNIVIPYSIAASTRLEKLQYKEILTPKWRICEELTKSDVKNGVMHRPNQDSDFEDMSEETITLRHERSEREESKRFMSLLNILPSSRLRHNRRVDSGANTPDPMSPHTNDFAGDIASPIISSATPSAVQENDHHNTIDHRNSSLQNAIRRRTNCSSIKIIREQDAAASNHEDDNEVLPYEPRVFPLSEELYDKMLDMMPDGHWQNTSAPVLSQDDEKIDEEAEMDPAESDTTESTYCDADGEDPNDPEWTVTEDRDAEKERIRSTAKR